MYLIFYDISETRLRTKVSKLLKQRGYERIQFSVFTGPFNPEHFGLWQKIEKLLKNYPTEKVYCLKMSKENFKNMRIIGTFEQDIDYLCGNKSSLTF